MKLAERIRRMIDGMPEGSSVSLRVETLQEWVDDGTPGLEVDLTVVDVAEFFNRSEGTVRTWIRDGRLSAYKLNGREYRIPRSAVEEFQTKQSQPQ